MGANDPRCVACLDPRGLIGRIYVGDHYTLLHTKYISSGPHGFREEVFPIISLSELTTPWVMASLDPGDLIGRIYGPLNIATYKIYKPWASWFQRRRFFKFFQL